jgi:hypothetical protein
VLPNLPVGPYRFEVRVNGFKDYQQTGIVLVVNNNIQIDAPMQVGSLSEKVEVTATASLVETKETSVASVIDGQRINDLPLNNRQATQLILTLGAAVYADSGDTGSKTFWNATRISVAGRQGKGTAYQLDGGDATDAMSNVNMPFPTRWRSSASKPACLVALRHASGRDRECGHQIGIQPTAWRRVRVHP